MIWHGSVSKKHRSTTGTSQFYLEHLRWLGYLLHRVTGRRVNSDSRESRRPLLLKACHLKIRSNEPVQFVPCILVTSQEEHDTLIQCAHTSPLQYERALNKSQIPFRAGRQKSPRPRISPAFIQPHSITPPNHPAPSFNQHRTDKSPLNHPLHNSCSAPSGSQLSHFALPTRSRTLTYYQTPCNAIG